MGHSCSRYGLKTPARALHSPQEAQALSRWAAHRKALVKIGVAEGASAAVLRKAMAPDGHLWLMDPFHLSCNPFFNTMRKAAERSVGRIPRRHVTFLQARSLEAAAHGTRPIDFLFIDGDPDYEMVRQDWWAWSRFVVPGGVVCFHDAVAQPGRPEGPVRLCDELFRKGKPPGWELVEEVDTLVTVLRQSAEPQLPPDSLGPPITSEASSCLGRTLRLPENLSRKGTLDPLC